MYEQVTLSELAVYHKVRCVPADEVSISLLFLRQGVEVLLDLKPHHARGRISKIVAKILGVHVDETSL